MMSPPPTNDRPGGLIGEIQLFLRYRRMVVILVAGVTAIAIAYSLITPIRYEAHTSLLPADDTSSDIGGLLGLIRDLPIQGANLPGVTTTTDLLAGMLHSRRIQDPVIEAFGLVKRYDADTMDDARIAFDERLSTGTGDEGILHVRFVDEDPELAAGVLNELIETLDGYNVNVRKTRGRLNREFIERRLEQTSADLSAAEDRLRAYQEKHAVALSPQAMAAAETVGQLMARKLTLEIELDALSHSMGERAPQIVQRRNELRALEGKIMELPELGLTALRYYRDVRVQEQLFVFLSAQVEQARIDERRDLPVIQVLDVAAPPEIRSWPRRKLIVIVSVGLAAVASVLLVHALDFVRRERDSLRRSAPVADA